MDPARKVALIRDIDIIGKIKSFGLDKDDYELCQSISDIISKLGMLVLEIVETAEPNAEYIDDAQNLLLDLLVLNIMFLECEDVKSSQYIVKFINLMVLFLKKYNDLSETLTEILVKIQDICIQKIEYPDWCTFEDGKLSEDEENYKLLRLDLVNLFSNTLLIPSMKTRAIEIISNKFSELKNNVTNYTQNQVELPLFLLTQTHATIIREDKDLATPVYQGLISQFLEVDFMAAQSKIVSILYFEICVKFASYFVHYPQAIPQVLENFMSEKGVLSPWAKLASRSSYFLLRFISRLKPQLKDCAELVFQRTKEVIKHAENGETQLSSNDVENFYEIIGSMLKGFGMDSALVRDTLENYFDILFNKILSFPEGAVESIVECVRRLNMLVKSLTPDITTQSKDLFVVMCSNLYPIFEKHIGYTSLRDILTVFVQKALALVGAELMDGVNTYINCLLKINQRECLDTCIRFINYVVVEMNNEGLELVDTHIITIFKQLENIGFPESNKSDIDKDRLSVFAKFMRLIFGCVQKNCLVLVGPNTSTVFENIVKLLTMMLKQNVEKTFRKEALMILRTILVEFSGCNIQSIKSIHVGDKDKIEERKISNKSEYENVYNYFVNELSKEMFDIFEYLNPSDPIDVNCVYLVLLIHVILLHIDPTFANNYEQNIKRIKPDIAFQDLVQNIELFSQNKIKIPLFKRNAVKVMM